MASTDFILRMAEGIGSAAAKMLDLKDTTKEEIVQVEGLSDSNIVKVLLERHIKNNKFNDAENLIFKLIDGNPSEELFNLALWMYEKVSEKSDEELLSGDFSRDEINQGINDIKTLKTRQNE